MRARRGHGATTGQAVVGGARMSDFATPSGGRMRLLAIIVFTGATLPGLLPAQRIEPSGVTTGMLRTEGTTPALDPVPLNKNLKENIAVWAGGIVGAVVGAVAGYKIGLANEAAETKKTCRDPRPLSRIGVFCGEPAVDAVLGGVLGLALGAFVTHELVARNHPQRAFHGWRLRFGRPPVRSALYPRLPLARTP